MATNKPILQALILADQIYTDVSGKRIIAGTFNKLISSELPSVLSRNTFAYLSFTETRGETAFQLRYVDLSTSKVLLETATIKFISPGPLESVEIAIEVPPFPMPHAGAFAFEVHCAGELLGSQRMTIALLGEQAK